MSTRALSVATSDAPIPADVQALIDEANVRIAQFRRSHQMPCFAPSDFERVYEVIRWVEENGIAPGEAFCEWGSGFGVVAAMASMLGFESCGVEIERELVEEARALTSDFGLDVEFIHDTFIPGSGSASLSMLGELEWIETGAPRPHLEVPPEDFDVFFAYPWPGEEGFFGQLFDALAAKAAILISYRGLEDVQVVRKTA